MLDTCSQSAESRCRRGGANPRVERAECDRLPSAAGQSSDPNACPIDVRIVIEVIESAPHVEIKQPHAILPGKLDQTEVIVLIAGGIEFCEVYKFYAESNDSPPHLVDASLLLLFHCLAARAMSVYVEDRGHLSGHVVGFIKQRHRFETGDDLVPQFDDAIPLPLQDSHLLELRRGINPFLRPAVIDDRELMRAQCLLVGRPLTGARRQHQGRYVLQEKMLQLVLHDRGGLKMLL